VDVRKTWAKSLHWDEYPDDRHRPDHGAYHHLPADRSLASVHHAVMAQTTQENICDSSSALFLNRFGSTSVTNACGVVMK